MFKTNIYRMPKGLIVDVTDPNDVLVWSDIPRLWNHSNKPAPDLGDAVELDCETLVRERITKITKMTEIKGEMRYALTERSPDGKMGALVEVNNMYIYSASNKSWSRPSFALAEILDATIISAEQAEQIIKDGTSWDPYKQQGA